MGLRGHGGAIAITAVVTMVIASAGTAVAVTSQVVTISDPSNLARKARVDAAGRLSVAPPTATVVTSGLLTNVSGNNVLTSPTTATLGITKLGLTNPSINASASFAEVRYFRYQVAASGGSCTDSIVTLLGISNVAPGDDIENAFPSPLVVKPVGGAPYCLSLYAQPLGGTYTANYFPAWQLAAAVVSGQYTPSAKEAAPVGPDVIAKQERGASH